jgi:hypothetical protein
MAFRFHHLSDDGSGDSFSQIRKGGDVPAVFVTAREKEQQVLHCPDPQPQEYPFSRFAHALDEADRRKKIHKERLKKRLMKKGS